MGSPASLICGGATGVTLGGIATYESKSVVTGVVIGSCMGGMVGFWVDDNHQWLQGHQLNPDENGSKS